MEGEMEGVPWGLIQAKNKLKDLQCKVDEALKLLKTGNPDIQRVIRMLEGKEDDK